MATATEYNQSKPLVLNFQLQFRFGMNISMVVTTLELNPMCSALFPRFCSLCQLHAAMGRQPPVSTLELSTSKTTFSLLHAITTLQQMPFPYLHNLFATLFFFFLALLLLLLTSCKISRELFHISSARPSPAFFELKYTHAQ